MKYVYAGHEGFHEAVSPRLAQAGAKRVDHVAEADTVLTFCTSQTALEDAYFDEDGFVQAARPETVLIDLSASTPGFARELNAVAVVSDLAFVEAPLLVDDITLPRAFSQRDNLRCFVAGQNDDIARAEKLLSALVRDVHKTGGSGSAQLARAAYSLQTAAQVVAAIEADALYRAAWESIVEPGSSMERVGATCTQADRVLAAINAGSFDGAFTVEMFMAELSAALTAADDADLILPQAEAAMRLLELLAVVGGSDKAPSALSLVYGDEKLCAENGLDWTRAEHAFASEEDDCGCGEDCGCDHMDYRGFDYSAN